MKTLIKVIVILFLLGCSKQITVYENETIAVFQKLIEIDVDAFNDGAGLGDEEKNNYFSHLGKDFSRSGGNLFISESLNILWETSIGIMKSDLIPFSTNLVASDTIVIALNSDGQVIALNSINGKILWKKDLGNRKEEEKYYCDNGHGSPQWSSLNPMSKVFSRMRDELGLEKVKPLHGFRAYVATDLLIKGVDSILVRDILRHKDLSTTLKVCESIKYTIP